MYVCKEMVIINNKPSAKLILAIHCNTNINKQKIHTIYAIITNLTIYMNKFQHNAHPVLLTLGTGRPRPLVPILLDARYLMLFMD